MAGARCSGNSSSEERDVANPTPPVEEELIPEHQNTTSMFLDFMRLLRDEHVAESLEAISWVARAYSKR